MEGCKHNSEQNEILPFLGEHSALEGFEDFFSELSAFALAILTTISY